MPTFVAPIRPRSRRTIVAVLYVLKSMPLRSRIRSSKDAKSRPSRPFGAAPPAARRLLTTSAIESRSAVSSTSDGEIERGIDGNSAVAGFSTTTAPPACLTCQAPAAPSWPDPVRMTATRPDPNAAAAVSSSRSTDGATLPRLAGRRRSSPSTISTRWFDGTTKMTPSSSAAVSFDDLDGQRRVAGQDLAQVTRSARVQVLGDDDRCRKILGKAGNDAGERLDAACGGADDDKLRSGRRLRPHDAPHSRRTPGRNGSRAGRASAESEASFHPRCPRSRERMVGRDERRRM